MSNSHFVIVWTKFDVHLGEYEKSEALRRDTHACDEEEHIALFFEKQPNSRFRDLLIGHGKCAY